MFITCHQHEEADTRIFVHAAYLVTSQGCTRVLGVFHSQQTPGLKELGSRNLSLLRIQMYQCASVFLPCHQITDVLSSKYPEVDITSVALAAYTITGCDTASYLFHICKKRTLKCTLENRDVLEAMAKYGELDGRL